MPLPDACNANFKIDSLHEILQPTRLVQNSSLFELLTFRKELENYLHTRSPVSFLNDFRSHFASTFNSEKQVVYNISLMNALTLYIGSTATQALPTITVSSVINSPYMDIFQSLFYSFDSQGNFILIRYQVYCHCKFNIFFKGRYLLLNSMVDHLRYPNNETLFYIHTIVSLFNETNEHVREQIARVLLERLLAHRPQPWGVTFTVNELIRNPTSKLLDRTFIKAIPDFEK